MNAATVAAGVIALGAGTYAMRLSGILLRTRLTIPQRVDTVMTAAVAVVFAALVATSTVFEAGSFAGASRVAGVAVGGVLAWRRAPFVLVVVAAAGVAAALRLLGCP